MDVGAEPEQGGFVDGGDRGRPVQTARADSLDVVKAKPPTLADAGAFLGGLKPGVRGVEVFGPKGPGSALGGPNGINQAAGRFRGSALEKNAVVAGVIFFEALA